MRRRKVDESKLRFCRMAHRKEEKSEHFQGVVQYDRCQLGNEELGV
jgi:hypothetical protein